MTQHDALRAAGVLDMYLPDSPAVEFLRELAQRLDAPCTWRIEGRDLMAADPGGPTLRIARPPGFARLVLPAWSQVGCWIETGYPSRPVAKEQRSRLSARLAQRKCPTLAAAVRDVRLRSACGEVQACYDPLQMPVNVRG